MLRGSPTAGRLPLPATRVACCESPLLRESPAEGCLLPGSPAVGLPAGYLPVEDCLL